MSRLAAVWVLLLLCTSAGPLTAQSDDPRGGESRLSVTGFVAYGFPYDRMRVVEAGGTTELQPANVPASEIFGATVRYRAAPRLAVEAGLLYRGRVIELDDCDLDEDGICQGEFSHTYPALLIARAGLAWSPLPRVPLLLFVGPAAVREADGPGLHWALAAGAGLEIPLPVAGWPVALATGLDTHRVWWNGVGSEHASSVSVLRLGLAFGLP